jgi:Spy/CpxP family protein refolding chaperone
MVGMLFMELSQVGLRPEQKTATDAIDKDLEKLGDATKEQKALLVSDVTDGVAAGKLNKAKIDADVKKLVQAAASTTASVQDAMTKLHKTLDAPQRKKLIELLQAKVKEHQEHAMGAMAEHGMGPKGEHEGPKGEHAEHAMGPKGEHEGPKGEHHMGGHRPIELLTEQLGLTPEQRDKLKTKLEATMKAGQGDMKAHMAAMQKMMKTLGDAFESDNFDAKKAGVGEHAGDMAKLMATSKIRFVEAVLSVLTPEQRAKFAEHIRQHAGDDD